MKVQERSKQEIEMKLASMGDYVKLDYLQRALGSGLDFETKKFVLLTLSKLYEARGMYLESAKMMKNAAEINTTFKAKITDFMKSVDLYIKSGSYQEADYVFAQALALATDREKPELKNLLKKNYIENARMHVKADKRTQAKKSYEKALSLDLSLQEKKDVQEQLLSLYEKLGLIRDYYRLRDSIDGKPSAARA